MKAPTRGEENRILLTGVLPEIIIFAFISATNHLRSGNIRCHTAPMTDKEIIRGLIDRDNYVTEQFLFVKCRPLLTAIMRLVFSYPMDYDEMVNELYEFLMADDGAKLKKFEYRSSVYQWMKVVSTRFFIRHRNNMIENVSKEAPYDRPGKEEIIDTAAAVADRMDLRRLLDMMENRRYAETIRRLILEDVEPEKYAAEIGVTVDNLYNIKKRAMAALTRLATKYYSYGQ